MKYLVTITLGALFLAVAPLTLAQKGAPSNYKHMKPLGIFVGKWKTEIEADKEIPGVAKKGDKLAMFLTIRWAAKKNALATQFAVKAGKKTLMSSTGIMGWHAGENTIISGGFNSIGGTSLGYWTRKGKDWHAQIKGFEGDGTKMSGTMVLTEISKNSFISYEVDRTKGDEKLPDTPKTTWKRVKKQK